MINMTISQTKKYIRDEVRPLGLVFRKSKRSNLYVLTDRKSKEVVWENGTIGGILNNLESGYLSTYDPATETFKGF